MKIIKLLLLPLLLFSFAFLFMATSKVVPCEGDCAIVQDVYQALRNGRESYVNYVYRCGYNQVSDTLCIFVKDTKLEQPGRYRLPGSLTKRIKPSKNICD